MTALAIGVASHSGSAAWAKQPAPPYEYGPAPDWARYVELTEQTIRSTMFDPEAAKFQWPHGYVRNYFRPFLSRPVYGYVTCGFVNGRNRFGAYVGDAWFVVVIDRDKVVYSQIGKGGGNDLLGDACRKGAFPPAPAPAAVAPAPAATPMGLSLMAVPDGAYVSASAPGSPGQRAGVVPGMVIVRINGISLKGLPVSAVTQILGGVTGPATLEVAGGAAIKVVAP